MSNYKPVTLSRRQFLLAASSTIGASLLAGCGATPATPAARPTEAPKPTDTPPTATTSAQPVIVALDEFTGLAALTVGAKPARVFLTFEYATAKTIFDAAGVPTSPAFGGGANLEAVAALKPTNIIGISIPTTVEVKDKLNALANTTVVEYTAPWRDQLEIVGKALGRADKAAEVAGRIDKSLASLKSEIATAGKAGSSVSVIGTLDNQFFALAKSGLVGSILEQIGLKRPALQDVTTDPTNPFVPINAEKLTDHDADRIVLFSGGVYDPKPLTSLALWPQLTAVRDKKVSEVLAEVWFMPNSFGADWIIRDLRAALLGDGTVAKAGDVLGRWDAHTAGGSTPTPQPIDQPKPTDVPMPTEAPKPTDLPASTSSSSDAATTTGAAFPVTIEHKFGSTTIARKPERIVCVGLVEQDALLALGIVPVGTTEWFGKYPGAIWPWAQDELAALGSKVPEVVGTAGEESLEKIAALRPDLILGLYSGITPEKYALLEKIAPVVAQPKDLVDYGAPWDTVTRIVGQAVGKAEQADALVKGIEARFEKIRAENPAFAQSTAIASMAWEGVYVYGPQDVRSRLLTSMGFKLPSGLAAVTGDKFGEKLSEEKVELLDNDLVVWIDAQDAKGPLGGPLYAQLNVAKQGREVFLNSSEPLGGATSFISVLSLPYLLDGLLPKITVALDGDPATVAK